VASKKTGNPVGRPSGYSDEIAEELCRRVMSGRNLISVLDDEDMPSTHSVWRWMSSRPDFALRIITAREILGERYAEKVLAAAEGLSDKEDVPVVTAKMRAWMWAASKYAPKIYSERIAGALAAQLNVQINNDNRSVNLSHMTVDEKAELRRLLEKAKSPIGLVEGD
jgi:hypothetical protein